MRILLLLGATTLLSGCISTAKSIVTLPVRAASYGVDKVTTSQSESDRNRGRKIRKQEEREARERRKAEKEQARREERSDRD